MHHCFFLTSVETSLEIPFISLELNQIIICGRVERDFVEAKFPSLTEAGPKSYFVCGKSVLCAGANARP